VIDGKFLVAIQTIKIEGHLSMRSQYVRFTLVAVWQAKEYSTLTAIHMVRNPSNTDFLQVVLP
jgi:hypothetical protein